MPDVICDSVVQPFRLIGAKVVFHQTKLDLSPDWEDIDRLKSPHTRALLMVNYFGQPQDVARYSEFCRLNRLLLIEDSAHGAFGQIGSSPVGTIGDIGVVSERKNAMTATGATLFLDGRKIEPPLDIAAPPETPAVRRLVKRVVQGTKFSHVIGNSWRITRNIWPPEDHSFTWQRAKDHDIATIETVLPELASFQRRQKWAFCMRKLRMPEFTTPFDEVSEFSSPWAFPFFPQSKLALVKNCRFLAHFAPHLATWPTFPVEVLHNDPRVVQRRLWTLNLGFSVPKGFDVSH